MRGEVIVMEPGDYDAWLGGGTAGAEGAQNLSAFGRDVAVRRGCVQCHTFDGQRHIGPTWARLFDSYVVLEDGRRVKADEAYLTRSMMEPSVEIVAGYPNVMPGTYRATLTQPEVGALVEFIKSLKDGPITPTVALPAITVSSDGGTEDAAPPPAEVLQP
jgi:cytochrome c oxidase subunit 2